jgi:hypothetical protein
MYTWILLAPFFWRILTDSFPGEMVQEDEFLLPFKNKEILFIRNIRIKIRILELERFSNSLLLLLHK